ncbi:hypothetical protein [Gilvimarinus agarilyticus]|uniref:hypothetical protein n=1 Tax=Gilvimarinus agarilyticus TaxID=679259 RepID=UPI0005A2A65C|nr:hypothetical protein [Gilvimarinus agarilyticus]
MRRPLAIRFFIGILAALLCAAAHPASPPEHPVKIAATTDVIADYQRFVGARDIAAIRFYGGAGARRDVIELVLLQQALQLGGFKQAIAIVREQTYRRTLHQVANGELIGSGALVWRADTADLRNELFISSAVIEDGEFIVGLYVAPQNQHALAATPEALRELTAVTSLDWKTDQVTLQALGFKQVHLTNTWVSIVRMLHAQRGDITLAPFQAGDDMQLHSEGVTLVPIPNIKVALQGSRHWIVSRQHPSGPAYLAALERGLAQMRRRGTIQRAYRESGFFNTAVAHWPLLRTP